MQHVEETMSENWEAVSFGMDNVEEVDYSVVSSYTNDDEYQGQMGYEENSYAEETPVAASMENEGGGSSFLDEITNLAAAAPSQPRPQVQHPDPLKALGDAVKGMSDDDFANDLAAILKCSPGIS